MSKRPPYWITEADLSEISTALRDDEKLLHSELGRGIAAEMGVARTRFENGRFYLSLTRALGKERDSFPVRLSGPELSALRELPLSDSLQGKLG